MRNGDAAKIAGLVKNGLSTKQICARFANQYKREEIIEHIPTPAKKKAASKSRAKSSSDKE